MTTDFEAVMRAASSSKDYGLASWITNNSCSTGQLPTTAEFYHNLTPVLTASIAVSTLALIVTLVVYGLSLHFLLTRAPDRLRGPTIFVITIHPASAMLAYLSVMIPRASYLVEVGVQDLYATCLYQMFCLLVSYCEDEATSTQLRGASIHLNTGPLCCLPCFKKLCRPVPLNRSTLLKLRILVLQLPVVMWVFYAVLYILWSENELLVDAVYPYLEPIQLTSVLLAGWGTNMVVHVLSELLSGVRASQKFLALELTMLLPEVQGLIAQYVERFLPCSQPFSPNFWTKMVVHTMTVVELMVLSLWSRSLYCREPTAFERFTEDPAEVIPDEASVNVEICEDSSTA